MFVMKYYYMLALVILTSSCSFVNTLNNANSEKRLACKNIANNLNESNEWVKLCISDTLAYNNGFYKVVQNLSSEELCDAEQDYANKYKLGADQTLIVKNVINSKGVNCDSYRAKKIVAGLSDSGLCHDKAGNKEPELAKEINKELKLKKINCNTIISEEKRKKQEEAINMVKNLSMSDLCILWDKGDHTPQTTEAARREVKLRKVDCPAVLSSIAQQSQAEAAQNMYQNQLDLQRQSQRTQQLQGILSIINSGFPAPPQRLETNCTTTANAFGTTYTKCN